MKKLICALALCAFAAGQQASAAMMSGTVSVEDIVVSTTGSASFGLTGIDYFIGETFVFGSTPFETLDSYDDIVAGTATSAASAGSATASAVASADVLASRAVSVNAAGNALAATFVDLGYEADGFGTVEVAIDVLFDVEIAGATGSEFVDIYAQYGDTNGGFDLIDFIFDGTAGDVDEVIFATLLGIISIEGPQTGSLLIDTYAELETGVAPVPVPAAAWLLATGLLGLGALARRRPAI